MKLTVRDLARVFDAPEATIERWIRDDGLPHHRVHGQDRFHRAEIIEWANTHGVRIASDPQTDARWGGRRPSLSDALVAGGVHYDVPATDKESMLRAVVDRMPLPDDVDRQLVFDVLLSREGMGSTGVGGGIAIPHVRDPVVLPVDHAAVTLCFLDAPIDFKAIDGKPVDTVFAIVAPTIRMHLFVLARLAAALHDEAFASALKSRAPADKLFALARSAEVRFAAESAGDANALGEDDDDISDGKGEP